MASLSKLQSWMQDALIRSAADPGQTNQWIAASGTLSPSERLGIYQRSYYLRLLQCMRGQFKALCHALEEPLFNDFAREYLREHPSQSPTLSLLGARFPDYLQASRPDADAPEPWIDFMIDLARFEWEVYLMFDAEGHEGKPYADEKVPDQELRLQPCFKLLEYRFPVGAYYHGVAQEGNPEVPAPQHTYLALCRKNYRTGIFQLLHQQHFLLNLLKQDHTLDQALQATAAHFRTELSVAETAWQTWKAAWLAAGFFIARTD